MRRPLDHRRDVIARESARLADVLAAADPAAPVPTCPGWSATDLLTHLVRVHDFWAHVVGDGLDDAGVAAFEADRPAPPTDRDALLAARADATARLLAALAERGPSDPAWSWFPLDRTVGFTWRMQTHEATMHRIDAELTAGLPVSPIDDVVAGEGIDHVLDVMWAWVPTVAPAGAPVVELVATDDPRTWRVTPFTFTGEAFGHTVADHPVACRAADEASGPVVAQVTGPVAQLDRFCWNRRGDVVTSGDAAALAALRAAAEAGIG